MSDLPFEDGSFDHVISRFGFKYTKAPNRTASEIYRVLRPGGNVALMVWGPMENNTVLSVAMNAANEILNVLSEDALEHPAIYAREGSLAPIFFKAGFDNVTEKDITF